MEPSSLCLRTISRWLTSWSSATAARRRRVPVDISTRVRTARPSSSHLYQVRSSLRALPQHDPEDDWTRLRQSIVSERRARRASRIALVLAAAVVIGVLSFGVVRYTEHRAEHRALELVAQHTQDLKQRSWLLESELRRVETMPIVLEGWRAQAINEVRQSLSRLDEVIESDRQESGEGLIADVGDASTPRELALWSERVELQSALLELWLSPVTSQTL